jgi:exonuclease SbcC
MEENGELIDLSGAARNNSQYGTGTNEEIRKILGTFDDFILTSLSLQNNGQNFIDKKQAERKKILSQFMGIDLFDKLFDIAKHDVADERAYLRKVKDKDVFGQLSKLQKELQGYKESKEKLDKEVEPFEVEINELEQQIETLKSKLKYVPTGVNAVDTLDEIKKEEELDRQKQLLKSEEEYREDIRPLYNHIYNQIKEFDEDELEHNYEKYQESKEDLKDVEHKIKLNKSKTEQWTKSLEEIKMHKFDEDCEYCVENSAWHISNKKDLTLEIENNGRKLERLLTDKSNREKDIKSFGDIEREKAKYQELKEDLKRVENDAYKTQAKMKEIETIVLSLEQELEKIYEQKKLYQEYQSALEFNDKVNDKIETLELTLDKSKSSYDIVISGIQTIENHILVNKTNKKNLDSEIKDLVDAEQKVLDYELYLKLVSADGIPRLIINDALPVIENEVNTVLDHMMAGFHLGITNEDKNINLYIRYDNQEWPLSLSSGMEKFVSSLALRVGLINVSNLPSPNFLVIDEGFGTLDTDNLSNMKGAFDYLKTRFNSVFIISHLDTIKDFMDYLLPINKTDKHSNVTYI